MVLLERFGKGLHPDRTEAAGGHSGQVATASATAVLNAHTSVVARVEEELAAADLSPLAWYDVLWAIRRAPRRRIRMADLADSLTISRGGLTKLADRLESAGLLRREPAADDGRGLYAVLTNAGDSMLRRMWPVYARVLRQTFVSVMPDDEAVVIAAGLDRATAAAVAHLESR